MAAKTVPLAEAKAKLSELIREVELGQEIEITKSGTKVARLLPIPKQMPLIGFLTGLVMKDDGVAPAVPSEEWDLS